MTLGELIKVNRINNIEVIIPDPAYPDELWCAIRKHYDCGGIEVFDGNSLPARVVRNIFITKEGVLQILLEAESEASK